MSLTYSYRTLKDRVSAITSEARGPEWDPQATCLEIEFLLIVIRGQISRVPTSEKNKFLLLECDLLAADIGAVQRMVMRNLASAFDSSQGNAVRAVPERVSSPESEPEPQYRPHAHSTPGYRRPWEKRSKKRYFPGHKKEGKRFQPQ